MRTEAHALPRHTLRRGAYNNYSPVQLRVNSIPSPELPGACTPIPRWHRWSHSAEMWRGFPRRGRVYVFPSQAVTLSCPCVQLRCLRAHINSEVLAYQRLAILPFPGRRHQGFRLCAQTQLPLRITQGLARTPTPMRSRSAEMWRGFPSRDRVHVFPSQAVIFSCPCAQTQLFAALPQRATQRPSHRTGTNSVAYTLCFCSLSMPKCSHRTGTNSVAYTLCFCSLSMPKCSHRTGTNSVAYTLCFCSLSIPKCSHRTGTNSVAYTLCFCSLSIPKCSHRTGTNSVAYTHFPRLRACTFTPGVHSGPAHSSGAHSGPLLQLLQGQGLPHSPGAHSGPVRSPAHNSGRRSHLCVLLLKMIKNNPIKLS